MIKPYTAVGLIPAVRGIRKRGDIKINLEHLSHLVKAAALSNDNSAFEKVAAPNADPNGVQGVPDLIGPSQKTSTLTQLPAGHYGILCFVPAPDGKSHVAYRNELTVEKASGVAA